LRVLVVKAARGSLIFKVYPKTWLDANVEVLRVSADTLTVAVSPSMSVNAAVAALTIVTAGGQTGFEGINYEETMGMTVFHGEDSVLDRVVPKARGRQPAEQCARGEQYGSGQSCSRSHDAASSNQ
jgi:hypothetical protein